MRFNKILGSILCLVSAVIFGAIILFPRSQTFNVNLNLIDGSPASLTVKVPVRGWAGDASGASATFISKAPAEDTQPQTLSGRIQMGNVYLDPSGTVDHNFRHGDSLRITWKVTAYTAGTYDGILWISQPDAKGSDYALYGRDFNYSAYSFLGISPVAARISAGVFLALGSVLLIFSSNQAIFKKKEFPQNQSQN